VTPPPALGSNAKVDIKTAAFIGGLTQPHTATIPAAPTSGPGTLITQGIATVTVNIQGKVPLKTVILSDPGKSDIGRANPDNYLKPGSSPTITLHDQQNKPTKVSKYHWEVFAPGDVEPCAVGHDVTASSITVACERSKAEEQRPQPLAVGPRPSVDPSLAEMLATHWEVICAPGGGPWGAGGPVATCCARQERDDARCAGSANGRACLEAERSCQQAVLERAPRSVGGRAP
jgi:hypothetical protein